MYGMPEGTFDLRPPLHQKTLKINFKTLEKFSKNLQEAI
jgi:hypothetical protein